MHPDGKRLRGIILTAAVTTIIVALLHGFYFDPLRKAETYTRDFRQCWGRKAAVDSRLVFLAIDKSSVQLDSLFPDEIEASPALQMMKAGFPWSREVYALVADRLLTAGARMVSFDLLFPTAGKGDEAFRDALARHGDRIQLGCDFVAENTGQGTVWRLDLPTETLVNRTRPIDSQLGYVTFWADPDGAVRRARYRTSLEELTGSQQPPSEIFESLEARILGVLGRGHLVPTGDKLFRFAGGPHTFVSHPIYEIFVPQLWERNYQQGALFKDKIVFIGPEGSWSHDEHATPFRIIDGAQALMPGPEIHLNALNAVLRSEFLEELGRKGELIALFWRASSARSSLCRAESFGARALPSCFSSDTSRHACLLMIEPASFFLP